MSIDHEKTWTELKEELSEMKIDKSEETIIQNSETPVNIICVLKTSNVYNEKYVNILYKALLRNTTIPFNFICLSNIKWDADFEIIEFKNLDWKGWWAKIEMFNYIGKTITIDLDTLIVSNIDELLTLPGKCAPDEIFMMKAPNPNRTFTTSIMAWDGDFSFVYDNFEYSRDIKFDWDQFYVLNELKKKNIAIKAIQETVNGIYSYKRQWKNAEQEDTKIIWFHGKPRIHEMVKLEIVNKNWV